MLKFSQLFEQRGSKTVIYYEDKGVGKTAIVLIHGWSCSSKFWRFQIPMLQNLTRVIAIDLPGHGKSDKPITDYIFPFFVKAVKTVLDNAGVDQAVLVGHSNGAIIAREFYRLYPDRVRAFVIADGRLTPPMAGEELESFLNGLRSADYRDHFDQYFRFMTSAASPELREELRKEMLFTPQHVMASSFAAMNDPGLWHDDPILVPTLAIMSEANPVLSEDYEWSLRKIIPHLEFLVLKGTSHFLMMEKPEKFNHELVDFLHERRLV